MFEALPDRVSVYEVSPRDGLQNERATVPLGGKLRLIEALVAAGLQRIEVTSFVSPNANSARRARVSSAGLERFIPRASRTTREAGLVVVARFSIRTACSASTSTE